MSSVSFCTEILNVEKPQSEAKKQTFHTNTCSSYLFNVRPIFQIYGTHTLPLTCWHIILQGNLV